MKKLWMVLIFMLNGCASEYFYENGKKVELTPVKSTREFSDTKKYMTNSGRVIEIKDEAIVKLKNGVDAKEFFSKFSISSYQKISTDTYLVKPKKGENLFVMIREMHHDKDCKYALPNRKRKIIKR